MSESEGIHGISATWNQRIHLQGFPPRARRLWPHYGANPLPAAGSSFTAADLCLAGLRLVSTISGAEPLSGVLAGEARGTALLRHGRPLAADQARGTALDRRRVPFALTPAPPAGLLGATQVSTPTIAPITQVAIVPETIDLRPSEITSSRRSGAMVESPAIMMPSEPKLAKPHIA